MKRIINDENVEEFKNNIAAGITINQLMEIYKCTRSTITSAKKRYGLIGLSPNSKKLDRELGLKKCLTCGKIKFFNEFYSNGRTQTGKIRYKPSCKPCELSKDKSRRLGILKEYLYSVNRDYKCEICGYNKNTAAIEFHHKNTEKKEYSISRIAGTGSMSKEKMWDILSKEVPKCIILCANCHREWHNPTHNI